MKAFKLVRYDRKRRKYLSYTSLEDQIYYVNRVTKRRKGFGPLAVFNNLKNARNFLIVDRNLCTKGLNFSFHIFECEIKPSNDKKLWMIIPGTENKSVLHSLPQGTLFADTVKLIQKVYKYE